MIKKLPAILRGGCAVAAALLTSCATTDPADANRDGVLTVPELESALVDAIIAYSDSDADGQLTLAEWQEVNADADVAMFRSRDLNRDGKINRAEAVNSTAQSKTWERLIKKIDTDGDGKIDEAEKAAFRAEMNKAEEGDKVNRLSDMAGKK